MISVGEGCLANDPPMLGQFLLVQIVAVQVPLIVAHNRGAAEAETVISHFYEIAIAALIFCDRAAVLPTVGTHGFQIL